MVIIQIYGVIFTFVGFKSVTLWQIPSSPRFALMSSKVVKDIPRRGYFEADAILDYKFTTWKFSMKQFFMAVGKPQDLFNEDVQKLIKRSLQRGYEKFAKQGKWFWS